MAVVRSVFTRSDRLIRLTMMVVRSSGEPFGPRPPVMRALPVLIAALFACAPAQAATLGGWSHDQQQLVLGEGPPGGLDDGRFHGERPLTLGQMKATRDELAARFGTPPVAVGGTSV